MSKMQQIFNKMFKLVLPNLAKNLLVSYMIKQTITLLHDILSNLINLRESEKVEDKKVNIAVT
jgi:hypothetical protein